MKKDEVKPQRGLKPGDVVTLKSGGPAMCVTHVEVQANFPQDVSYVTCIWQINGMHPMTTKIMEVCLQLETAEIK